MISKKKDLPQNEIDSILNLFNTSKFELAKKEIYKKIITYPKSYTLLNMLAAVYGELNQLDKAVENYNKAIKINPNYAEAHNNLGVTFHKLMQMDKAVDSYKKAINFKEEFTEAYNNLGSAMREKGKNEEAIINFKKAIQINPNYAEAYNNLGTTYQDIGEKNRAIDNFEKAIKIKPNYAEVYHNLGMVFSDLKRFDESLFYYNKAINLKNNNEKFYNNLGNLLNNLGKFDQASTAYNQAIKIKKNYSKAYSNLLLNLNYKTDFDADFYLSEAKKFRLNCKSREKINIKYQYEKKPKKLKVGFMSADFGNHPGGFFTLSTLKQLKKKNFELFAYATTNRKDEFSDYFKPLFSKWHLVEKKKDEEIIEEIVKDGIHILFDLQGHSAKNRLTVFMYKPAPIQATWLGQGSTGIHEIDYFIGSPHITPRDEEKYYVEKVLRLPEISQCFTPPMFNLESRELPALKNGFVTFGSANKLSKVNEEVITLWSKILLSVDNAKLLLKNKDFDDKKIIENTFLSFKKRNVDKDRLILIGESKTRKELLEIYNEIDIALDPFPFQGNTSSIEAIWMGVPVLTLKGNRYLFHFGESINTNLSMKNWIANNQNEYISKAVKFSSDLQSLSKIRMNLRKNALKSPVFDATRFAKHFDKMLWNMWKEFELKKNF